MDNEQLNMNIDNGNGEKKPSLKTTASILAVLGILLVVILIFVRGCTVSKNIEQNDSNKNGSEVVLVGDDKNNSSEGKTEESENTSEDSVKNDTENMSEIEGNTGETSSKEDVDNSSETVETENTQQGGVILEEGKKAIYEVAEPELSAIQEMSVLVSGKHVYRTSGSSYAYSIGLIFPSSDGYVVVEYFCPKKTYNEVTTGDTVTATFQLDKNGVVAITSISK